MADLKKNNIFDLEDWKPNQLIEARKLQQPVSALRRLGGLAGASQVFDPQRRILQTKQFKVVSLDTDVIICNTFDGVQQGTDDIKVAMPFLLRKTPFDGFSRDGISYVYKTFNSRTASRGSDEEEQVIVDSYFLGDVIYATRGIFGGTAVYLDAPTNTIPIVWLDDNRDGRYWAQDTGDEEEEIES